MPQAEIDLDKIIREINSMDGEDLEFIEKKYISVVKLAMREACRQILLIASERAKMKYDFHEDELDELVVDKESVTSCINSLK